MAEDSYKSLSILNSGEHVLLRIHDLWKQVHFAVSINKYYQWDVLLDRVWCELVNLMDDNEYSEYSKEMKEIKGRFIELGSIVDNFDIENGFNDPTPENVKKIGKQYNLLMSKEEIIRKIQRKVEKKVIKSNKKDWN